MLEWEIDKVLTLTVNNASSNNVTILYLKNVMKDLSINVLSNEHLHVRCYAHIVNESILVYAFRFTKQYFQLTLECHWWILDQLTWVTYFLFFKAKTRGVTPY